MKQRLIVFAGAAAFVGLSVVGGDLPRPRARHVGRRVAALALPAGLQDVAVPASGYVKLLNP